MIKKAIHNTYRHLVECDTDFEILYYRNHTHLLLEYFIKRRLLAYYLILVVSAIGVIILQQKTTPASLVEWIFFGFVGTVLGVLIIYFFNKKNLYEKFMDKYFDNSDKLCDLFLKLFTLFNNRILSIKDWKIIKSLDPKLYLDLTSDASFGFCYHYSRELGLVLKNVSLVWCSLYGPLEHCHFAHAFILKDGYLYDSNLRLSYKFEDYAKITNLKVYKTWSYEEFSIPNFRSSVREDFRKWCKENNVESYSYF